MKIELHGNGWNSFQIPRFCGGVAVNEGDVRNDGMYPVKAIERVTVLSADYIYVAVELREDDEHLPQKPSIAREETLQAVGA